MKIVRAIAEVRESVPAQGVGLVPTMGALHAGHLALFEAARGESDFVAASIFVNPPQFGPGEDYERYPRAEDADAKVAEAAGVDLLFVPSADEMYPAGYETWVEVERLGGVLEGAFRPGHFRAVATVCLKLFNIMRAERAYFGQKDAQQVAVIKRMVRDLNVPVQIRVVPTVRDRDGLAVSSRNAYLSADERRRALALPRALAAGEAAYRAGQDAAAAARAAMNGLEIDHVEAAELDGQLILEAAVRVGRTRLIDNVVLEGER